MSSDNRSHTNHELNHRRRQHPRRPPLNPSGPNLQPKITAPPPPPPQGEKRGEISLMNLTTKGDRRETDSYP